MECPNIDKEIVKDKFNTPINYKDLGGPINYIFYEHSDPYFKIITRIQFCKKIGRKKDVFECLNEHEWKECYAYKMDLEKLGVKARASGQ